MLDITERKLAEKALRESEEKYRLAVENSHDVIYQADMDGRLIFASPSSIGVFGYPLESALGTMISDHYAVPEDRAGFLKMLMEQGFVTGFEAELVRRDGSRFWGATNARLLRDEKGNPIGVEGVLRDVTEAKSAEQKLKESEEKYRNVVEESFRRHSYSKGRCYFIRQYSLARDARLRSG